VLELVFFIYRSHLYGAVLDRPNQFSASQKPEKKEKSENKEKSEKKGGGGAAGTKSGTTVTSDNQGSSNARIVRFPSSACRLEGMLERWRNFKNDVQQVYIYYIYIGQLRA